MKFVGNIIISLVAVLAVILGGLAFGAVFDWITWDEIWDWFAKIALGGVIMAVVAIIVSMVVGAKKPQDEKK
jgi:Trk-type K+ transport system membrane component